RGRGAGPTYPSLRAASRLVIRPRGGEPRLVPFLEAGHDPAVGPIGFGPDIESRKICPPTKPARAAPNPEEVGETMQILQVGNNVFQLRFLPDNRRLVVGTADADRKVAFDVLSRPGGERVRLDVPRADLDSWWYQAWYGNAIAVHPSAESCYIAWAGDLYAFRTADGKPLPVPKDVQAHQVVLSPDGERLMAAHRTDTTRQLFAVQTGPDGSTVVWQRTVPREFSQVAGFLPDGE